MTYIREQRIHYRIILSDKEFRMMSLICVQIHKLLVLITDLSYELFS